MLKGSRSPASSKSPIKLVTIGKEGCKKMERGRIEWASVASYARCICDLHSYRRAPPRSWLSDGTKTDFRVTENSWQERCFSLSLLLLPLLSRFDQLALSFCLFDQWTTSKSNAGTNSSTFPSAQLIQLRFFLSLVEPGDLPFSENPPRRFIVPETLFHFNLFLFPLSLNQQVIVKYFIATIYQSLILTSRWVSYQEFRCILPG